MVAIGDSGASNTATLNDPLNTLKKRHTMFSFKNLIATTLGLGLLASGVISHANPEEGSGTGANGMKPENFWDPQIQAELWAAMDQPLSAPNSTPDVTGAYPVNPWFKDASHNKLLTTPAGKDTFLHAVRCGLAKGISINAGSYGRFKGGGILKDTQGWLKTNTGLATQPSLAKQQLFQCMLTLLNGVTISGNTPSVTIALVGDGITTMPENISGYNVSEAIWIMGKPSSTQVKPPRQEPGLEFWVHPEQGLRGACANSRYTCSDNALLVQELLNKRICGSVAPDKCRVKQMSDHDFAQRCTKSPVNGHWTCDGMPAIETRLSPGNTLENLHPGCSVTTTKP